MHRVLVTAAFIAAPARCETPEAAKHRSDVQFSENVSAPADSRLAATESAAELFAIFNSSAGVPVNEQRRPPAASLFGPNRSFMPQPKIQQSKVKALLRKFVSSTEFMQLSVLGAILLGLVPWVLLGAASMPVLLGVGGAISIPSVLIFYRTLRDQGGGRIDSIFYGLFGGIMFGLLFFLIPPMWLRLNFSKFRQPIDGLLKDRVITDVKLSKDQEQELREYLESSAVRPEMSKPADAEQSETNKDDVTAEKRFKL